jgi:hypothetical protein
MGVMAMLLFVSLMMDVFRVARGRMRVGAREPEAARLLQFSVHPSCALACKGSFCVFQTGKALKASILWSCP